MVARLPHELLVGLGAFYRTVIGRESASPSRRFNLRFLGNDLTWIAKASHFLHYEYTMR